MSVWRHVMSPFSSNQISCGIAPPQGSGNIFIDSYLVFSHLNGSLRFTAILALPSSIEILISGVESPSSVWANKSAGVWIARKNPICSSFSFTFIIDDSSKKGRQLKERKPITWLISFATLFCALEVGHAPAFGELGLFFCSLLKFAHFQRNRRI